MNLKKLVSALQEKFPSSKNKSGIDKKSLRKALAELGVTREYHVVDRWISGHTKIPLTAINAISDLTGLRPMDILSPGQLQMIEDLKEAMLEKYAGPLVTKDGVIHVPGFEYGIECPSSNSKMGVK